MESLLKKCNNLTDNEKKILSHKFPRTLTKKEQNTITDNLKRITPDHLFFNKTYDDKIIDFIANPLSKSLLFCNLMILVLLILKELGFLKFLFNVKYIELYVVFIMIIGIILYHQQINMNDNTLWMLKYLPENATYGTYLRVQPKPDTHKPIFKTFSLILLTAIIGGIINITKNNSHILKYFN